MRFILEGESLTSEMWATFSHREKQWVMVRMEEMKKKMMEEWDKITENCIPSAVDSSFYV